MRRGPKREASAAGTQRINQYTIQYATELSPADWQTLRVETATANAMISIVDNPPPGTPKRFYRLLIP